MKIPTLAGAALALLAALSAARADVGPADDAGIRRTISAVAHHNLRPLADGDYTPVDSLDALRQARKPEGLGWIYPWGVTLSGLTRYAAATGDAPVAEFVRHHNEEAARYYVFLEAERGKLGAPALKSFSTPLNQLMALGTLDSCGAMGVAMIDPILAHRERETAEEKVVLARIADWIAHRQDRLPDGTLWRAKSNKGAEAWKPGTVWLDDLYMACPFLVRWSAYTGDPRYRDDAARQIIQIAGLLQDTDGLMYHTYFINEHRHSPIKWGRANGWAVVATVDVLSALPPDHPARPRILSILRRQLEGVKRVQAPSGLWPQVLDHPELWEETSCSAMFAYGFARAANRGWIDRSNLEVARKAFAGLQTRVKDDGEVDGTCEGTNIGLDLAFYANRQRPPNDLHGPGVVELAGAEILAGATP